MPPQIDFLPVATGGGATVDTQGTYAGSSYQVNGVQPGIAQPGQANKLWRQGTVMAAALATFISNALGGANVLDDGNLTNLVTQLTNAIRKGSMQIVAVTFSATPIFDASLGNVFEITLIGNVTSSTFTNVTPGQDYIFIIHQDATGSRTFAPPANVPLDTIGATATKTYTQKFIADAGSTLRPLSPMSES